MATSDEMRADYERRCDTQGPEHLDTLQVRSNLVAALIREGRYADAIAEADSLIDTRARVQGADRVDTLKARRNRCLAVGLSGDPLKAYRESVGLLNTAVHALGLHHSLTDTIRADEQRWKTEAGVVDPPPAETARVDPQAFVAPEPEEPTKTILDVLRDSGVNVVMKEPADGGWSDEERRAVYDRLGKDSSVIDRQHKAASLVESGRYQEALALLDRLIPELRGLYSRDGKHIFRARLQRCQALHGVGRRHEAVEELQVLAAETTEVLGRTHELSLEVNDCLLRLQVAEGDHRGAAEGFQQLAELAEQVRPDGENPKPVFVARAAAAVETGNAGHPRQAYEALSEILNEARAHVPADDDWLLRTRYNQASALGRAGQLDDAIVLMQEVVDDMDAALGPLDLDTRDSREALAYMLDLVGRREEAIDVMKTLFGQAREAAAFDQARRADRALQKWGKRDRFRFGFGV